MLLDNICVILVEPQGSLNIGSTARAMMNFGISDLRLVNPSADHLNDQARRMAVKAATILENSSLFASLEQALTDTNFSIATTRRFGKYRGHFLHPEEAAALILPMTAKGKIALVFGREDHGLATADLEKCQRLLTIPSHKDFKSLNLAQSVAICLFALFNLFKSANIKSGESKNLASGDSLESLFCHMRKTLLEIEYLDPQNPDHILRSFRSIFGRTQLDEREVRILHGLFSRIDWIEGERRKAGK